jgi:hypothetical protein
MWQLFMCIYGHTSDSETFLCTPCDSYLCVYMNIHQIQRHFFAHHVTVIYVYIWTYISFRDIFLHTMWQLFMCIYGHTSDSETLLSTPCNIYFCGYINIRFRDISLCIYGQTFPSFIFSFQIYVKLLCFIDVYTMPTPHPIAFSKSFWSFRVES